MNLRRILPAALVLIVIAFAFPPDLIAAGPGNCRIKAVKDVYLEVYYSLGGRKSPTIRKKNEMMWSGALPRGGIVPVSASNGWVHLTYQDLTREDPRTENRKSMCQSGNIILIPR